VVGGADDPADDLDLPVAKDVERPRGVGNAEPRERRRVELS
jgi:hypothetical protein